MTEVWKFMKKYEVMNWLFFVALVVYGLIQWAHYSDGQKIKDYEAYIKQDLSQQVSKDSDYQGLIVKDVQLIKEGSNKYTGFVVYGYGQDEDKPSVTLTVDGDNTLYKCDPPTALLLKKSQANLMNSLY